MRMDVFNGNMAYNILLPIAILLSGVLVGFLMERLVRFKLLRLAIKSRLNSDDIIIGAFRGMFLLWFSAAGAYFSIKAG